MNAQILWCNFSRVEEIRAKESNGEEGHEHEEEYYGGGTGSTAVADLGHGDGEAEHREAHSAACDHEERFATGAVHEVVGEECGEYLPGEETGC